MITKTFHGLGVDVAKGYRNSAKKALKQGSNQAKSNADVQSFLITNCTRKPVPDSRTSNPAKTNENEKHDLADQQREKLKDQIDSASGWYKTSILPVLTVFTAALPAAGAAMALNSGVTLAAKIFDLGAYVLKIGMHKSHGWEMKRLTDGLITFCKFVKTTAEVAVHFRAPVVAICADTYHLAAVSSLEVVDIKTSVSLDEIHRVANAFGLEATYFCAVLNAAAAIHAGTTLDLKANAGVNISAPAGTVKLATALGGISIGPTGRIDLNPLIKLTLTDPLLLAPVVPDPSLPLMATQLPAAAGKMPQYEGQGAHGALIV